MRMVPTQSSSLTGRRPGRDEPDCSPRRASTMTVLRRSSRNASADCRAERQCTGWPSSASGALRPPHCWRRATSPVAPRLVPRKYREAPPRRVSGPTAPSSDTAVPEGRQDRPDGGGFRSDRVAQGGRCPRGRAERAADHDRRRRIRCHGSLRARCPRRRMHVWRRTDCGTTAFTRPRCAPLRGPHC